MPTDDLLRNNIFKMANLDEKWGLLEGADFLKEMLVISMVIGVSWMLVVQICTKVAVWVAIIGSQVVLLLIAAIPALDKELPFAANTKVLLVYIPLILCIFLAVTTCVYRRQIHFASVFLYQSAKFLRESLLVFLLILPMVFLTLAFVLIATLQHFAFKSMS